MRADQLPLWIFLWTLHADRSDAARSVTHFAGEYAEAARLHGASAFFDSTSLEISRDDKGKPYFPSIPDLHFSLSHSGDYGACAFYGQPVGLDLQLHTPCRREAIARRFFHPDEQTFLERHSFVPFFQIWTAKESYLKYTGDGLSGGLSKFSVVDGDALKTRMGDVGFYRLELPETYSLCLCTRVIPDVRIEDRRR